MTVELDDSTGLEETRRTSRLTLFYTDVNLQPSVFID